MSEDWCRASPGGVRLSVQVLPNARKNEIAGLFDDVLKIRLQAQPIEGRANQALAGYLAQLLGVPRSAVTVLHGQSGRRKIVEVRTDRDPEAVRTALLG